MKSNKFTIDPGDMNVDTAGDKEIQLTDKKEVEHKGHDHAAPHMHVEEEECALENDTRTVYLDQGMGATKND